MSKRTAHAASVAAAAAPAEAGHAETAEHVASQPQADGGGVTEGGDGGAPASQEDEATMRPGATHALVRPPVRESPDGVQTSNPETPFITPAPPLSVEDENVALRAQLEALRKSRADANALGECAPGYPRLVTAQREVFYNNQRYRDGDTFAISHPEHFSTKGSMTWATPGTEQRQTSGTAHLKQIHDDLLGERTAGATGAGVVLPEG